MSVPCIEIKDLTAGYDRRPAVHHIHLHIPQGSLTAIIGPNGAGKSTFLKSLVGLIKPMSGTVRLPRAGPVMAYLPQVSEIDRSFPVSVFDLALMGWLPRKGFFSSLGQDVRQQTMTALEQVGMASFAKRPIGALSTGQFQRVLFARLILQEAEYYLLDEPFAAIDSRTIADLLPLVKAWHKKGKTVLSVLHDFDQVKEHFPDALLLSRELIAYGKTAQVLTERNLALAKARAESWQDTADLCLHENEAARGIF